jgi:non-specific serine/threonine protein kinase
MADAALSARKFDQAAAALAEACVLADRTGERLFEPELFRLRGELATAQNPTGGHAQASIWFERSLARARALGARSWELRAALSLASQDSNEEKSAQAREALLAAYSGFHATDEWSCLQKATAILERTGGAPRLGLPVLATVGLPTAADSAAPLSVRLAQLGATASLAAAGGPSDAAESSFRKEGDCWALRFAGSEFRVLHTAGMAYIAELLRRPYERVPALALVTGPPTPSNPGLERELSRELSVSRDRGVDAGVDAQAVLTYKNRLRQLRSELEEAEKNHDQGRIERSQAEIAFLTDEIQRARGYRGRSRRIASQSERARVNVTRAIKVALRKIHEHDARLARHLSSAIRTGGHCTYSPEPSTRINWAF